MSSSSMEQIMNAIILLATIALNMCFSDAFKPRFKLEDTSPEQVRISLSGSNRMRISWITPDQSPPVIYYGTSPGNNYPFSANGTIDDYKYLEYKSGQIHNAVTGPLNPNTVYYYRCGSTSNKQLTFKTPPAKFPITFAVVGDFGQTDNTIVVLDHINKSRYDVLILPGDLSYADLIHKRWDSFGNLVEPMASRRPWMVTHGNHEIEEIPLIRKKKFTAYKTRWIMPYNESGSPTNLFYSFEVAGVHVLMLGSYTDFWHDSDQYKWLLNDLKKVNRAKTPWLFAVMHAPWYNSNQAHRKESASEDMKKSMEELLYKARVDAIFAGHVHAYERFSRVYKDHFDECGPVYITIGTGGNHEGLAKKFQDPENISFYRDANYGHGQLLIMNATHARWTWNRIIDKAPADGVVLKSLASSPSCNKVKNAFFSR